MRTLFLLELFVEFLDFTYGVMLYDTFEVFVVFLAVDEGPEDELAEGGGEEGGCHYHCDGGGVELKWHCGY